jgi:peptidoglycan/xylan/chitin deacetylase (PgdA/CDA1 family)
VVAAAAGTTAWAAVSPYSELFGPVLRHTDSPRKIALTFDDGPNPAVTPKLLDLFDRYAVRGTFFLIGKFARACPGLVKEIQARGHLIGNHTDTHVNLIWQTPEGIRSELERCQHAIASATGLKPPRWMRPPYGYRNPLLQGELRRAEIEGMVMWSKICWDWKPQPPQRLIERLSTVGRTGRKRGDIVVMHDGDHRALGGDRLHVVAALEHWLPRWRDAGMEFVTMETSSQLTPPVATMDSTRPPRA